MKRFVRFVAIIAVISILTCSMSGCASNSSKIKNTLGEFEYACQNLDIDSMLDCIDPMIADPIRLAVAIYSGATGQDYEDFLDGIFDELVGSLFGTEFDPYDFLGTISISDTKIKAKSNMATAECTLNFEIAGEHFEKDAEIYLTKDKDDDNWYISSINVFPE